MSQEPNPSIHDITYPETDEFVYKWNHIYVNRGIYLFYKRHENDVKGFNFYSAENVELRTYEECGHGSSIDCIIWGVVYYDGVRHLYYGDYQTNNYGYHYYPDIDKICLCLGALVALAKQYNCIKI